VLGYVFSGGMGVHKPDAAKNSPYECGFEAFEDARMKFDVRYYLVAILFILFDLEIAFLFPWAVALKEIGPVGFWSMMIFLASWWSASSTSGRRARSTGSDSPRAPGTQDKQWLTKAFLKKVS
jgi:NADH:ubiquinone oxidoreductase subunit 3 (subunit A)